MSEVIFRRLAQAVVWCGLVAWTLFWLVDGRAYMYEHSIVMQQGFGDDGIQMWEVFNLKMVAAHHAVRWLGGALAAGLAIYLLRRARHRDGPDSAVSSSGMAAPATADQH